MNVKRILGNILLFGCTVVTIYFYEQNKVPFVANNPAPHEDWLTWMFRNYPSTTFYSVLAVFVFCIYCVLNADPKDVPGYRGRTLRETEENIARDTNSSG